jgi:hypothetical protein
MRCERAQPEYFVEPPHCWNGPAYREAHSAAAMGKAGILG